MTVSLVARCDAGNSYGTCPATLGTGAFDLARAADVLRRCGWTIDEDGRTYCDRHPRGRRVL